LSQSGEDENKTPEKTFSSNWTRYQQYFKQGKTKGRIFSRMKAIWRAGSNYPLLLPGFWGKTELFLRDALFEGAVGEKGSIISAHACYYTNYNCKKRRLIKNWPARIKEKWGPKNRPEKWLPAL